MAWSPLTNATAVSNPGVAATTGAIDTTGATLIILAVTHAAAGGTAVITDSQSNSWTALTAQDDGSGGRLQFFYKINPSTSATHTFTAGAQAAFGFAMIVASFKGTTTFTSENGANSGSFTGNITTTSDGQLVVGAGCATVGNGAFLSTVTAALGGNVAKITVSGGNHLSLGMCYAYAFASGSVVGMTFTDAGLDAVIAAFTATGSSGGSYGFA